MGERGSCWWYSVVDRRRRSGTGIVGDGAAFTKGRTSLERSRTRATRPSRQRTRRSRRVLSLFSELDRASQQPRRDQQQQPRSATTGSLHSATRGRPFQTVRVRRCCPVTAGRRAIGRRRRGNSGSVARATRRVRTRLLLRTPGASTHFRPTATEAEDFDDPDSATRPCSGRLHWSRSRATPM